MRLYPGLSRSRTKPAIPASQNEDPPARSRDGGKFSPSASIDFEQVKSLLLARSQTDVQELLTNWAKTSRELDVTRSEKESLGDAVDSLQAKVDELEQTVADGERKLRSYARDRQVRNIIRGLFFVAYVFLEAAWAAACFAADHGMPGFASIGIFYWALALRAESLFVVVILAASSYELLELCGQFRSLRRESKADV